MNRALLLDESELLVRPSSPVGGTAVPIGPQNLQRHDSSGPAHAGYVEFVVPDRRDDAGAMCAVAVVVYRVAGVVREIVAVYIVDVAILVIVDARRAVEFDIVDPQITLQVAMVVVHAGVDDGDNHFLTAAAGVPRLRRTDFGQRPLVRVERVVGRSAD